MSKHKTKQVANQCVAVERKPDARLLDDVSSIVKAAEDSGLKDSFFGENCSVKDQIRSIAEKYDITSRQAVIFSVLVNLSREYYIDDSRLANFFSCQLVDILRCSDDLVKLAEKRLIIKCKGNSSDRYILPNYVIDMIKKNVAYRFEGYKCENEDDFFEKISKIFNNLRRMDLDSDLTKHDLNSYIKENSDFHICRAISNLHLDDPIQEMWLYDIASTTAKGDGECDLEGMSSLYGHESIYRVFNKGVRDENCKVFSMGLVEKSGDAFWGLSYKLSNKGISLLLPNYKSNMLKQKREEHQGVTLAKDISEKQMFYNSGERELVDELTTLLMPENFKNIKNRLKAKNRRVGFASLLYGGPGTGKTETVLQIARKTGRNVISVDMSSIRDKYVGESEKNVKAIFEGYKVMLKEEDLEPILLFNEADAIIGKRIQTQRSVDKMENAMQNILLQEMENFEGIMIATTNLTCNLDSAFERRFLYKIMLSSPSVEARTWIWKSMIPYLDESTASLLADEFCFSGGQMENIARKCDVSAIIHGKDKLDYDAIRGYCLEENIKSDTPTRRKIGFTSARS